MIDFKKVYQAVNRSSNTDSMSISNNYSMPQNVYDLEDYVKNLKKIKGLEYHFNITHKYIFKKFSFLESVSLDKNFFNAILIQFIMV